MIVFGERTSSSLSHRLRLFPLVLFLNLALLFQAQGQDQLPQPTVVNLDAIGLRRLLSTGKVVPIDGDELQRRIGLARKSFGPRYQNRLARVTFTATLTGERLSGRFTGTLASLDPQSLTPLGRPNLRELQFSSGPQVGAASTGELFLVSDNETRLAGSFSLPGRRRAWGTEFTFSGFACEAATLRLRLPAAMTVMSDGAEPAPSPTRSGKREWTILLEKDAPTLISVIDSRAVRNAAPFVDANINWSVGQQALSFRAEYNVETNTPVSAFSIPLPVGCSVESVSYGDSENLAIDIVTIGAQRVLDVRLPALLRGSSRKLTVMGRLPSVAGKPWTVPTLSLTDCTISTGAKTKVGGGPLTQVVRVNSPLEISRMQPKGYEQQESVFAPDGSHRVTLARVKPTATLNMTVATPRKRLSLTEVTRVRSETTGWTTESILLAATPLPSALRLEIPERFTPLSIVAGRDSTPCRFTVSRSGPARSVRITSPSVDTRFVRVRGFVAGELALPMFDTAAGEASRIDRRLALVPRSVNSAPAIDTMTTVELRSLLEPANASFSEPTGDASLVEILRESNLALQKPARGDQLTRPAPPEGLPVPKGVIRTHLVSRIGHGEAADFHLARLELPRTGTLQFQLAAEVQAVTVDGRGSRFEQSDDQVRIQLGEGNQHVVEVRYEVQGAEIGTISKRTTIPVPSFEEPAEFTWSVRLPDGYRLDECAPFGPTQPKERTSSGWQTIFPWFPQAEQPLVSQFDAAAFPISPEQLSLSMTNLNRVSSCKWLTFAGFALLGSLMAMSARRTTMLCVAAGVLAFLACVLPSNGSTAPIVAAGFQGLLIPILLGGLLHQKPKPRDSREVSTVMQRAASIGAGIMLCLSTPILVEAQDQPAETQAFRVFRLPNQDTVYVGREWLDRIDKLANVARPSFLLREARYDINTSQAPEVTASLTGFVPNTVWPTEIRLPFGHLNPERCEIDGREAVFLREGKSVLIRVPETSGISEGVSNVATDSPRKGEADNLDAGVDSEDQSTLTTMQIKVVFRPPWLNGRIQFSIPAAAVSRVLARDIRGRALFVNGKAAGTSPSRIEDEVRIDSRPPEQPSINPELTNANLQNQCDIVISADAVTLKHRLRVEPGPAPLQHLDLAFPANHQFVSLEPDIAGRRIIQNATGKFLSIDLPKPISEPIELTLKLIDRSPLSKSGRRIDLQPLLPGESEENATVTVAGRLALKNLRVVNATGKPIVKQPLIEAPGTTINVDQPLKLECKIALKPALRSTDSDQTVTVRPDGIDYRMEARIQIANGPVFQHSLKISPELQIDTVRVREGNVDQLARYQRSGNRLILPLENSTSGTQDIVILGRKKLKPGQATAIPTVRFENASETTSTLLLIAESDVEMTLAGAKKQPSEAQRISQKTFDLLTEPRLPPFIVRRPKPIEVTQLCVLDPTNEVSPQAIWIARCRRGTTDGVFGAVLPEGELTIQGGIERDDDGNQAAFRLTDKVGTLQHTFAIVRTSDVPAIGWTDATLKRTLVAIPNLSDVTVLNAVPAIPEEIPAWAAKAAGSEAVVYEVPEHTIRFNNPQSLETTKVASLAHVEHHVWVGDGIMAGRTEIVAGSAGRIPVTLPETVGLTSVRINSVPTDLDAIQVANGTDAVAIGWQAKSATIAIPEVTAVDQQFVILHSAGAKSIRPLTDATVLTAQSLISQRPTNSEIRFEAVTDNDTILAISADSDGAVGQAVSINRTNWMTAAAMSGLLALTLLLSQRMSNRNRIIAGLLVTGLILTTTGDGIRGGICIVGAVALRYGSGRLRRLRSA